MNVQYRVDVVSSHKIDVDTLDLVPYIKEKT